MMRPTRSTLPLTFFLLFLISVASPQVSGQDLRTSTVEYLHGLSKPEGVTSFHTIPHFPPEHQDTTLVCWSFATTSFIESEMMRLGLDTVRLAVMFPVYNVFLEKAKRFVATRGASRFAPGDLFTGAWDIAQTYGLIPAEAYAGQSRSCPTYNQDPLYNELDSLMAGVRLRNEWDESSVLQRVRAILDRNLTPPPATFRYRGKEYTPLSFLHEVVRLPWSRYIKVISFQYAPFGGFTSLRVPDNWRHDSTYFNVPLDVFYQSMTDALAHGYSFAVDADISEPEYRYGGGTIAVPPFDISRDEITAAAREYRFVTGATIRVDGGATLRP